MPYTGDLEKDLNEYLDPTSERAEAIRSAMSNKYDFSKVVSYTLDLESRTVSKTEIALPDNVLHPQGIKETFRTETINVESFDPLLLNVTPTERKSKKQLQKEAEQARKQKYMNQYGITEDWQLIGPYDSFTRKIKRWWMLNFGGWSTLRRIEYDVKNHHYVWNETFEKKSDLTRWGTQIISKASNERSVHVTGEPNTYFLLDNPIRRPRNERESGFGAISAYLYMKDNSYSEALLSVTSKKKKKIPKEMSMIWIIGAIVVGVLVYFIMF